MKHRVGILIFRIWAAALAIAIGAPGAAAELSCKTHKGFSAVDLSQPVTSITTRDGRSGVAALKGVGVKTVIRYYNHAGDTISCKTLLPPESDAIIEAGLSIATVFQHEGHNPETFFAPGRGAKDARRAIHLANINGQPAGSAIYFAVDGVDQTIRDMVFEHGMSDGHSMSAKRKRLLLRADRAKARHIRHYARFLKYYRRIFGKDAGDIRAADMLPFVKRYFRALNAEMKGSGYKIGAYGSGLVCATLLEEKLADYCWLAQSKGWPGYDAFHATKKWTLAQEKSTFCGNWKYRGVETVRIDFNRVNTAKADFGQWATKGPAKQSDIAPADCGG